jgi:hypothetical protein
LGSVSLRTLAFNLVEAMNDRLVATFPIPNADALWTRAAKSVAEAENLIVSNILCEK